MTVKWLTGLFHLLTMDFFHFNIPNKLIFDMFSFKNKNQFVRDFLKDKVRRGMKIAVATFGEIGSMAWDGSRFYEFSIFPAEVVNTVGAGDSFIAGFLCAILNHKPIDKALEQGAKVAAQVVSVFEPWVTQDK